MDKKITEQLPDYVEVVKEGDREVVCIDPNKAYPEMLIELQEVFPEAAANCYWITIARRCISNDLKTLVQGKITPEQYELISEGKLPEPIPYNDRFDSFPILNDDGEPTGEKTGDKWAFKNLPEREEDQPGHGEALASAHFNAIYKKLNAARKAQG